MIVGLANPSAQYNNTRHNMGDWYIKSFIKNNFLSLIENKKFLGFTSSIMVNGQLIRLLLPNVFMNINGYSVYKMASFYDIDLSQILIVHDDLDLLPGIVKIKYSYGHSGHNGIRNIINIFKKNINFYRLRIGIGRPDKKSEIASFVLSKPHDHENILLKQGIIYAIRQTFILINS
ncbi:aminoacyl-tRNA hydrolase [Buchnera aphidicola]|uniref:aminoacyl-tRNA hydrolase n=1 Tax=Buchnera aphidicola TaxID=9 RepID=UPI003BEEB4C0